MFAPGGASGHDGVGIDEKLPGAGHECQAVGFACGREAAIEADQGLVPTEGGRECGGIKGTPKASSAAGNMALASVFSAVVIERGKPCQRGGLLSADAAELGHPDDQGQRGAFTNARNTHDEIKSNSQVGVSAQLLGNEA